MFFVKYADVIKVIKAPQPGVFIKIMAIHFTIIICL